MQPNDRDCQKQTADTSDDKPEPEPEQTLHDKSAVASANQNVIILDDAAGEECK